MFKNINNNANYKLLYNKFETIYINFFNCVIKLINIKLYTILLKNIRKALNYFF